MLQQHRARLLVALRGRNHERRESALRRLVHFHSARAQRAQGRRVAAEGGKVQAAIVLVPAAARRVCAHVEKPPHNARLAVLHGDEQRRAAVAGERLQIYKSSDILSVS